MAADWGGKWIIEFNWLLPDIKFYIFFLSNVSYDLDGDKVFFVKKVLNNGELVWKSEVL